MIRNNISSPLIAVILLLLFSFQLVAAPIEEFPIDTVRIEFVNAPTTSTAVSALIQKMRSQRGNVFSQSVFDADLKNLAKEFAHVEPQVTSVNGKIDIVLKIWKRPIIHSIQWNGNRKIRDQTLNSELEIACGSEFDRLAFNKAFQKIRAYYIKKGYFEADLDYTVTPNQDGTEVDIVVCIEEGRSGKIDLICITGVTAKEEREILSDMLTKKYNILTSWYTNQGIYNEEMVQYDQYKILSYLQNKGYADAEVDIRILESQNSGHIAIDIEIEKGCCYGIANIEVKGNTLFETEDLKKAMCVKEGGVFSPEAIHESINKLTNLYGRYGYIDVIVDIDPDLIEETLCYNLTVSIEEGKAYRVGLIKVFGNCTTDARIILHESLLVPGEIFNLEKLRKTEERLCHIGYFEHVNVYPAQSSDLALGDEGCEYRDLHIEVEETGTGSFSAFFGYSNQERLFGGVTITEKNFNWKGFWDVSRRGWGALRGGGEFMHLTLNIGQRNVCYDVSWTQPFFRDTPWTVGVDFEHSESRVISDDYKINTNGGSLHATYPINAFLRVGTHLRVKNSEVDVKDNADGMTEQIKDEVTIDGLVCASGVSLIYDSTDRPICPREGLRSRLAAELGTRKFSSLFLGLSYTNTWYYPLCNDGVFRFRADHRFILPCINMKYSTVPIDERIFLGGDNTIRGYRPYKVGEVFDNSVIPRGGLSMMLYSAEYNHAIFEILDGFLFVDGGYISKHKLNIENVKFSAGFGIRLKILGQGVPITFGYGFPLNPSNNSEVKRFFWSMGGRF